MSKKIILLDVDGVLAGFTEKVLDFMNERHSRGYTVDDVKGPLHTVPLYDPAAKSFIMGRGFCQSLPVLPGGKEAVEEMKSNGHRVLFVTSPYYGGVYWTYDRTKWLERHFKARHDDIIFARDKRFVSGHIFVDDKASNVVSWDDYWKHQADRQPIIMRRPWTEKTDKKFVEMTNWENWKEKISGI